MAYLLADNARRDPAVVRVRGEWLRGQLVPFDKAEEWIAAEAFRAGKPVARRVEASVPPATVIHNEPDGSVRFEPPVEVCEVEDASQLRWDSIAFFSEGREQHRPVAPGTRVDELRRLSERLAQEYGWLPSQATMFVLTGSTPSLVDVKADYEIPQKGESNARIVLKIDPSLPPDVIAAEYKRARAELMGKRRVRRLSIKHLQLLEFCVRYDGEMTWPACMAAWNRQCGRRRNKDWCYTQAKLFKRDARAARRRLLDGSEEAGMHLEYAWDGAESE